MSPGSAVRVGVLALLAFMSAPAGFVSGPVGVAHAQQQPAAKIYRIGFLSQGQPPKAFLEALQQGLRERGYAEGRNVVWEFRSTDGSLEQLPQFARALQRVTTTLPVVVTVTADPVLAGVAASVARPGGNFTGLSDTAADLSPKQLELLKGILPTLTRVGVLSNPDNVSHPGQVTQLVVAAQKIGVQVVRAEASTVAQIEPGFALLARQHAHAVILFGDTFFSQQLHTLARAALNHGLPSTYITREYAEAGGLMSYGANIIDNFRRAATYVDKILKGANPAQLPFEQPTRYALVITRKTARALGVVIPQSVLMRTDGVVD